MMLRRLAPIAALACAATLSTAVPANAVTDSRSCDAGGGILNSAITYDLTTTQHVWKVMTGTATGSVGSNNNFLGRILVGSTEVWRHASADTYGDGEQWSKQVLNSAGTNVRTNRSSTEYVKTTVWFDQLGDDPSCTTSITY